MEEKPLISNWPSQEVIGQFAGQMHSEIKQIDFGTLRSIFSEYAKRSGIDPNIIDFQDSEKIMILTDSRTRALGQYTRRDGVQFNAVAFQLMNGGGVDLATNLRRVLFHEETHASSHQEECGEEEVGRMLAKQDEEGAPSTTETSGYSQEIAQAGKKSNLFYLFNEGVTDLIAEEVYAQYHSRTGDTLTSPFLRGYEGKPQYLVELLIQKIAANTGVQKDNVWESLIQGYFSGLNLNGNEIKQLFLDTFGFDIVDKISRITTKEQIDEILIELEQLNADAH